jgi:AAA domain
VLSLQLYASDLTSGISSIGQDEKTMIMQNLFRHAQKLYQMVDSYGFAVYQHDWAKACLVLIQSDFSFEGQDQMGSDVPTTKPELLKRIEQTFEYSKSGKLQCLVLEMLCHHHLRQNQCKEILVIAQKGKEIASYYRLNIMEGRFQDLFNKAEDELKSQYENMFMFLVADPIPNHPEQGVAEPSLSLGKTISGRSGPKEWSPSKLAYIPGPEIMDKRVSFRKGLLGESITKSLKNLGKKVSVHFDACTRKILKKLYDRTEGAKVLVLQVETVTPEYFVVEDENFGSEKITVDEMFQLNQSPELNIGVDVLILTGPKGECLARYFRESSIKYIVYFEIPERKSSGYLEENQYDFVTPYWVEKFKECFISKFLVEFCSGGDAFSCLKHAKIVAVETIKHLMGDSNPIYKLELSSFKPACAIETALKLDFEFSQSMIQIEENCVSGDSYCKLMPGYFIDCSPPLWQQRDKFDIPDIYIRREADLSTIYQKLQKHERIQLVGPKGCGKTFLALLLQKELSLRNVYADRVFYFDIGTVKIQNSSDRTLYTALRQFFGEEFVNNDAYFANKRMLLIIDEYQRVLDREYIESQTFSDMLTKYHIHAIFITHPPREKEISVPDANYLHQIQGFSPEECLACMLSLGIENSRSFFKLNDFTVEKLIRSDTMKEIGDSPAELIAKAARFYDRELSVTWKRGAANKSGGRQTQSGLNISSSFMSLDMIDSGRFFEDLDDKFEQAMNINTATLNNSAGNTSTTSSNNPKAGNDRKEKKQSENKKDEKQPKQRKKNKDKKSMC